MAGTPGTRRVMAPGAHFRGLMTWGSSSMAGGIGAEGSPVPCWIIDLIGETVHPLPFLATAVGATQSPHTRVQMGLDTPRIQFDGAVASTASEAPIAKILDGATAAAHRITGRGVDFTIHGRLDGTPGVLRGRRDQRFTWTSDDGRTRVRNGNFVSEHRQPVLEGDGTRRFHHLIWTGKNNITAGGGREVIDDTDALVAFAGGAAQVIVMAQWITPIDSTGQRAGSTAVNDHQRQRYGAQFLDLQRILTTAEGLSSPPVEGLRLLDDASVQRDLSAGHVPRRLVAADGFHLNGWGNHVVAWALIEKMKELQWL